MPVRPPRLPLATAVAGALLIAFSAPFVALADVSPATAAVFRCAYALPALGLLAWRERRRFGPRSSADRRVAAIAGVFFAGDLLFWHHAIAVVGAGLATVLGNCQVVVVGLVAWGVLGERPPRRVLTAVPLVLMGVVLISGAVGESAYGANPGLGALYGLLTAVCYAGFLLMLRRGNRDPRRPAGPLLDASFVGGITAAIAGALLGELVLTPSWPAHGWLVALALNSQVLAWLLISVSLPRLPALVTSVVLLLQPVGAVGLGMVLLNERPSVVQLGGTALVLAGVVLATARPRAGAPAPGPADAVPLADPQAAAVDRQGPSRLG